MMGASDPWWVAVWPLFNLVLFVGLLGMFIYGFALFVKFAKKGIEAFDLYIKNNKKE